MQIIKKFLLYFVLFLLLVSNLSIYLIGWDNFKLRLVRAWGLVTITNNPLLKSFDKDLKDVDKLSFSEARVDISDLHSGGPSKGDIPSIDNPQFVSASESEFDNSELIIGVVIGTEARAYPYSILNWHEIVNDTINDVPITVTLCPLCDTNPVFRRVINGQVTTFGVSGKLYQSCLVMYDRLTDTMWSQPWGIGVVGKKTNDILERIPASKTTLGLWKRKYPNTLVLSSKTGYSRNYQKYPYGTYYTDKTIIFPVRNQDNLKIHPKEIESYIWLPDNKTPKNKFSGESFHITHKEIEIAQQTNVKINSGEVLIVWGSELKFPKFSLNGSELPSSTAFGFVYPAFFE